MEEFEFDRIRGVSVALTAAGATPSLSAFKQPLKLTAWEVSPNHSDDARKL